MQNTGSADHLQLSLSSLMLVGRKSRTLSFFAAFSISPSLLAFSSCTFASRLGVPLMEISHSRLGFPSGRYTRSFRRDSSQGALISREILAAMYFLNR
jgi:hypothetical protein